MNLRNLFPFIDVEEVRPETDYKEVNALLRAGWLLLSIHNSPDGASGFFAVYVLGKLRPPHSRLLTDRNLNEYDQRPENEG